jgi:hypothetical protein
MAILPKAVGFLGILANRAAAHEIVRSALPNWETRAHICRKPEK